MEATSSTTDSGISTSVHSEMTHVMFNNVDKFIDQVSNVKETWRIGIITNAFLTT